MHVGEKPIRAGEVRSRAGDQLLASPALSVQCFQAKVCLSILDCSRIISDVGQNVTGLARSSDKSLAKAELIGEIRHRLLVT